MPNGLQAPRHDPEGRLRQAADMLDTLGSLIGQADDLDLCGRDGLAALLDLLAEQVEAAAEAIERPRSA